jgi:hypothetical protein
MCEREPGRIGKAAGRPVHDFRNQRERTDSSGADPWYQQQLGEILRAAIGRCGEGAVQPPLHQIVRSDIVVLRQHQMGQERLGFRFDNRRRRPLNAGELAHDLIGAHVVQHVELPVA